MVREIQSFSGASAGGPSPYISEPTEPVALGDDARSDAGSTASSALSEGVRLRGPGTRGPGSIRSRYTRISQQSRSRTHGGGGGGSDIGEESGAEMEMSMFEWNGGGSNVYLTGSWDNYTDKIPMESVTPGQFRAAVMVPQEKVEFKFIVDGRERYNPDYPTIVTEEGEKVNVKNVDPIKQKKQGKVKKIFSKISGLDMYSKFQYQEVISMWIFRVFYLLTIPAGCYYFYWLIARGGNRNAKVSWIFFIVAEIFSFLSAIIGLFGMWKPVKRKWRSLDALKPPLPEADWPTVDVVIAHYKEPAEQIRGTIEAALRLDYPAHLLRVIVADDGYFPSVKSVERSQLGIDMYRLLAEEAQHDPFLEEVMNEQGLVEHYVVKTEEELPRSDCAKECHVFDFGPYGEDMYAPGALPRLSLISRVKPEDHHNKAGNINNVLFNAGTDGKLILFLDADMMPRENFLLRVIPLMLEEMRDDAIENTLNLDEDPEVGRNSNTAWRINRDIAFVQAPQRFHNVDEADYMAHRNALFYDGICTGRDGFGLTPFVGTNAVWRREVLNEIGGLVYGSVTEDTLTSNEVHRRGYISRYAAEDMCYGEAPVTVAAALLQRQRWAKGAVMNGMKIFKHGAEEKKKKMIKRRRGEIDEFYEYRRHGRRPNNALVRGMFWLDSTLYPFLGVAAYLYIFVAAYYLFTAEAPISPQSLVALAAAFVTYYSVRYIAFYTAFWDVSYTDILRGQETWFSYNISHIVGIYEAFNRNQKLGWVANTGQRQRRNWMEWWNIILLFAILVGMTFRLVAFLAIDGGCEPWQTFGSLFFGFYIAAHLWPMCSISVNERLSSRSSEAKMGKTMRIPLPLIYSAITILGVVFLSKWADSPSAISGGCLSKRTSGEEPDNP